VPTNAELRYLIDTYLDWTKAQNLPVVDGVAVDLSAVETAAWPRLGAGCRAAFVHLRGRGDFVALQVIDIPQGSQTERLHHLFDEVFYVLSGSGRVTVALDGNSRPFEFGPRALLSPPMNAPFRIANIRIANTGRETLRIVCATDLPFVMNIFRNEDFLFNNRFSFPERWGQERYFQGEGDFLEHKPGTHMWETNFIPDLVTLPLPKWEERGAGSRNVNLILSDSSMHAHVSEIPAATYKKAYCHTPGAHVLILAGSGYTLMWKLNDADFERHEWKPGTAFALPDGTFHQHFNTAGEPARYLSVSIGSCRYPVLTRKVVRKQAPTTSWENGGPQVEYADQDPRIHQIWLQSLAREGQKSAMGQYFDEQKITSEMA
jgi:mannose-6-phosphate isomerase-like protein (cupin superfamily)